MRCYSDREEISFHWFKDCTETCEMLNKRKIRQFLENIEDLNMVSCWRAKTTTLFRPIMALSCITSSGLEFRGASLPLRHHPADSPHSYPVDRESIYRELARGRIVSLANANFQTCFNSVYETFVCVLSTANSAVLD